MYNLWSMAGYAACSTPDVAELQIQAALKEIKVEEYCAAIQPQLEDQRFVRGPKLERRSPRLYM